MLYPDSCNKRRDAQLCIHLRMLCTWQGITRKIRDAFAYYVVMRYRVYHAYYNYVLSLRRTMKVRHLSTLSTLHTPSTPQHKAVLRILRIVPDYPTDHPTHFPIMVRLFYIYICLVSILPRSCGRCRESVPCVPEQAEFMHSTLSSYSTVEGLYQIVLDIGLAMLGMVGRVWVWAGCCCRLWLWHCRSIFGSWVLPVV